MNERIKELMEQATEPPEFPANIGYFNPEKFAELIVKECAEVMVNDPWLSDVKSAARGCARSIKQHFGVEE